MDRRDGSFGLPVVKNLRRLKKTFSFRRGGTLPLAAKKRKDEIK